MQPPRAVAAAAVAVTTTIWIQIRPKKQKTPGEALREDLLFAARLSLELEKLQEGLLLRAEMQEAAVAAVAAAPLAACCHHLVQTIVPATGVPWLQPPFGSAVQRTRSPMTAER